MLLSTNQELRLHIPSNAVDDVTLLSGIIDNSEKDFLRDKLGAALYERLCEYYNSIDPAEFCNNVINGSYTQDPWAELLLNAQRMVTNDALARFAYQQVISVNGAGINVVSGNDYGNADDRLLDKGVGGYKKEAAIACNNLLILLEEWSKYTSIPAPIIDNELDELDDLPTSPNTPTSPSDVPDGNPSGNTPQSPSDVPDGNPSGNTLQEIVELWQQSKYFYHHGDLLIPTAEVFQRFLDIYENRDKFIRLLPDLRFIQDEYIEDAFGEDFVLEMLSASKAEGSTVPDESSPAATIRLLRKTRRLIIAYVESRTTVLSIDKTRRQQAHDEAISLKTAILTTIKEREQAEREKEQAAQMQTTVPDVSASEEQQGFKNNDPESRVFVSPLLY